jgi:hypothetical protein
MIAAGEAMTATDWLVVIVLVSVVPVTLALVASVQRRRDRRRRDRAIGRAYKRAAIDTPADAGERLRRERQW